MAAPARHSRAGRNPVSLITDNIDIWSSAVKAKSAVGRGTSKKIDLYGIKKLRELILELAVRGLLVPQDPNEEPASVLLKKIADEKDKLEKEGKIKNQKSLPPIGDNEKQFKLPVGWEWCRLAEIIQISSGTGLIAANMADDGDVPVYGGNGVTGYHNQGNVFKETLVIGRVGYYCGSIHVTPKLAWVTDNAFVTTYSEKNIFLHYLAWLLKGTDLKENENATAQPVISGRKVYPIIVALPPNTEQHRIVAKIDELMALCDQLEQQTEASISAHQTLVKTLLETLTNTSELDGLTTKDGGNAENAGVIFGANGAWARITEHFDTLFTTEWSIDQLKQTILQLAVMGKLVPQNPSDEPASELLKKIVSEKDKLIKEGKIKKQKPLPTISEDEKPFELPARWEWCRLQDSIDVRDGTHDSPKDTVGENTFPLVTSKNFVDGEIDFENARRISEEDHNEISKRSLVEVDDILFSMIGGNIGNQVIVRDPQPFSIKNVALFKYYDKSVTDPKFFKIYTEELAIELQQEASGGAQPFVSLGALRKLVFALPPIEEQHRIVVKVEELMVFCDTIKANINTAKITQLRFADAMSEQAIG